MNTLFETIYTFFHERIFNGNIGSVTYYINGEFDDAFTASLADLEYPLANNGNGLVATTTLDVYLSLIASIISIVVIVLLCCALIKKIYNMCAHVIG